MTDKKIAIRVCGLGKKYQLGGSKENYLTLRDAVVNSVKSPFKRFTQVPPQNEFWALKDVSFDVESGEVVGIIGRNGAGKSTLLKILSRITSPTEGTVELHGRVGSLLEVGTGFHPEMTGRENIYLSGAILGMKKQEIEGKFEEIIKFAEIEKFLDTPAKRYSSGMYVRLAFAVAAHMDTEILLVDEVLAVGDAAFQKKCLGKMENVSEEGRTVLIVSHNMNVVENLCTRAILIEQGYKSYDNTNVREVILKYTFKASNDMEWRNPGNLFNNPYFTPQQIYLTNNLGEIITHPFINSEDHYINICGNITQLDNALQVGYALYNESHELIYWSFFNDDKEDNWPKISIGLNNFIGLIPKRFLNAGIYYVELIAALYCLEWISQPGVNSPIVTFKIEGGLSDSPYWLVRRPGIIAPLLNWRIEACNNEFSLRRHK